MAKDILVSLHGKRVGLDVEGNLIIDGVQVAPAPNPTGAQDYYVDGNRSASGDGLSWDGAYKTLAEAIAASNTSIALTANRWWARRNRIFVVADSLAETLVAFPTKCDVIGLGAFNGNSKPGLTGHHVPAAEAYSTRWINMHFTAVAAAAPMFTLAGASGVSGNGFFGCTFDATVGTVTEAILATASLGLEVVGCEFIGEFATDYIGLGAGEAGRLLIEGNRMLATAAVGITVNSGMTATWPCLITDNDIKATGLVVDDNSDLIYGTKNRMTSDTDATAAATGAMDVNHDLWTENILTSTAGTERNAEFPFQVQFTS